MDRSAGLRASVALVLDVDPDLGAGVAAEDWEAARRRCRGELLRLKSGSWALPSDAPGRRDLVGLVIVSGAVCRELSLRDRHMLELLGPGDVVHVPVENGRRLGGGVALTAVLETELLVLGRSFIGAAARWPSLLASVQERLESQGAHLAVQGLIAHLPRAEHRLLLVLHHLADRWGTITPDGTVLPLALSHDLLGQLAAARRSTTTLALSALERDDELRRLDDGSWLITRAGERRVRSVAQTRPRREPLGRTLAERMRGAESRESARALRAEAGLARRRPRP